QAQSAQQLATLAAAQARSEDRFAAVETQLARLAEAQQVQAVGLGSRFAHVDERLERLAAAQETTATQLALLTAAQRQTSDRLGILTGWTWEAHVRDHAPNYLGQFATRVRVLLPPELDRALQEAGLADE